MKVRKTEYDVLIIGGGPAGMAAALWSSHLGLTSIVFEQQKELGGQLLKTYGPIVNYVGVRTKSGAEMRDIFAAQLVVTDAVTRSLTTVERIDTHKLTVTLADGSFVSGRAIIIATGVKRRRLGVPGESDFAGRGILESGVASRHLVRGKQVVIVGGGDAAFENALILAENAESVTILHRSSRFSARAEFITRASHNSKITIVENVRLEKITGGETLEEVEYVDVNSGTMKKVAADALLIRIGVEPNTEIVPSEVKRDEMGYIVTDRCRATNIPLVFAIGDVANSLAPTISGAVGDAATAARAAYRLLAASKRL